MPIKSLPLKGFQKPKIFFVSLIKFYRPQYRKQVFKDCIRSISFICLGRIRRSNAVQIVLMITVPVCVDDVTTILDAKKPLEDNNVHIFPIGKYNKYIIESYSPKLFFLPTFFP